MKAVIDWLIPRAHAVSFQWDSLIVPQTGRGTTVQSLADTVLTWIFTIAGILAVIYLVYAGIIYITAGGNPDAAKKGQQGIINAIIGIVIIVLAYVIVASVGTLLQ